MECFDHLRRKNEIKLLAFCVMPDHFHFLLVLMHGKALSPLMGSIAKFTASGINNLNGRRGRFWQEGFFDHRCRDNDDALDRLSYIEQNPVRAGLVDEATAWPYSSASESNVHLLDRAWYAERC